MEDKKIYQNKREHNFYLHDLTASKNKKAKYLK